MINHARTLLLNQVAREGTPGEEYIDANFQPVSLSASGRALHVAIFGSSPDRLMKNYRAAQLLPLLHTAEFEPYVRAADSRVTYLPWRPVDWVSVFRNSSLEGLDNKISFTGAQLPPDITGRCSFRWSVELIDPTHVRIVDLSTRTESTEEFTTTNGLSSLIPLSGSTLSFRLIGEPPEQLTLQSQLRPARTAVELYNYVKAVTTDERLFDLFPPSDTSSKELRQIWEDHPWLPCRLAAVLLGLVNHTARLKDA